jgi:hypothetical protein
MYTRKSTLQLLFSIWEISLPNNFEIKGAFSPRIIKWVDSGFQIEVQWDLDHINVLKKIER